MGLFWPYFTRALTKLKKRIRHQKHVPGDPIPPILLLLFLLSLFKLFTLGTSVNFKKKRRDLYAWDNVDSVVDLQQKVYAALDKMGRFTDPRS
ncbi:hypothetical protein FHG87_000780 [Trinorchestia longiramus]|nr:hypothetical protein FHG87_000780 [Trinorchestia longiramus]